MMGSLTATDRYQRDAARYIEERDASGILVDETHAVMTARDFRDLREYSATIPTGMFVGKRWKRNNAYPNQEPVWLMGEYVEDPEPDMIGIKWRHILVVE